MSSSALYQNQFSPAHDFPQYEGDPARTVIIGSTGRSGSHMLGHYMRDTGAFGFPLEYLHPGNIREWRKILGTSSVTDTLTELQRRRTSPNGVFGIKIHYWQMRAVGGFSAIQEILSRPVFVLIRRRNVLAQAVSFAIAQQTGVWIEGQKATGEAAYDAGLIDKCLRSILMDTAAWQYTLSVSGARWMEVVFEEVISDPALTVKEIASFSGVELDDEILPKAPSTKPQRTSISDEWARKFVEDGVARGELCDPSFPDMNRLVRKLWRWSSIKQGRNRHSSR